MNPKKPRSCAVQMHAASAAQGHHLDEMRRPQLAQSSPKHARMGDVKTLEKLRFGSQVWTLGLAPGLTATAPKLHSLNN